MNRTNVCSHIADRSEYKYYPSHPSLLLLINLTFDTAFNLKVRLVSTLPIEMHLIGGTLDIQVTTVKIAIY